MSTRNIQFSMFWLMVGLIGWDIYIFIALSRTLSKSRVAGIWKWLYGLMIVLAYAGLYNLVNIYQEKPLEVALTENYAVGFFFSFLLFKAILTVFFLAEDLYRIVVFIAGFFKQKENKSSNSSSGNSRRKFIRNASLSVASVPFLSMLYGITQGKYNFKLKKLSLQFENLPQSFDGFRIVQISDIHAGSFDDTEAIERGVRLINEQKADLILFTGDLVNNDSREVEPYMELFSKLEAPNGVYSVLGNHDYGDYKTWPSIEAKEKNMELLYKYQENMGFQMLNNRHTLLERNEEKITLMGVENWGNPPFPQRGDLNKALEGAEEGTFKILMSHDPTHWNKIVADHPTHIDLTLAGHTHGMQFGVEIPGFKWSPIKYIYPQWAGLYEKEQQYLYVNRGFGFLGFPGRVGIWPEITVFELGSKS